MPTFGDKWEIDRNKLRLGDLLGRGNYGVVYQALYETESDNGDLVEIPVAVKTLKGKNIHKISFNGSQATPGTQTNLLPCKLYFFDHENNITGLWIASAHVLNFFSNFFAFYAISSHA